MGYFANKEEPLGRFISKNEFQLAEDLLYHTTAGVIIKVPSGTITDFASIPRFFWRILPPMDIHRKAAIVHDYLYSKQTVTKAQADSIFLEAMAALNVPAWKRQSMYHAVRWFGFKAWNDHKTENEALRAANLKF
jgi:hypothetical protein